MTLYERAIRAKTFRELYEIEGEANHLIGNRAPIEQEEFFVYGYVQGRLWEMMKRLRNETLAGAPRADVQTTPPGRTP